MKNIIKVNIETLEEDFEFLLNSYITQKGWKLENISVEDYCEYESVKPDENFDIRFNVVGHKKHIHAQTGEPCRECIGVEKVHIQYDFLSEKMYGFYQVISFTSCESLEDGMFEVYMSQKSREIL